MDRLRPSLRRGKVSPDRWLQGTSAATHPSRIQGHSLNSPYQSFFLGLDLGQSRDFTALAILELVTVFTDEIDRVTYERKTRQYYRLRHLDRIPLHTDYETIVEYIRDLLKRQDLNDHTTVVVDAT